MNPEKYVIWHQITIPHRTVWAQTHIHLSDLKFEVPQARTACTLRLQKISNNIKNDLLLRKEDFLLKRFSFFSKTLLRTIYRSIPVGRKKSSSFFINSVPSQTGGYQTKQSHFSSPLQGDRNQVNPRLSVKRKRTQREREQDLWNSRIKVSACSTEQTIQRNRICLSCYLELPQGGPFFWQSSTYWKVSSFLAKDSKKCFHVLMHCLLKQEGGGIYWRSSQ